MKKGEFCVKILSGAGFKTATIQRVESVKKGVVKLEGSGLSWDAETLYEVDPAIPGFNTYLVPFDGGEEKIWGLADKAKAR